MNKRNPLPLIFVLLLSFQLHAQNKHSNSLLWKITGNGLQKPSYLFGTIHVQDQRLFNFSDSLYSFISDADGFALEVHPDSMTAALMQRISSGVSKKNSDELLSRHLSKKEFARVSRKLKELGIDAGKLTVKEAYDLQDKFRNPEAKDDDMTTFVDAYLFGVARTLGKQITGLESMTAQMDVFDEDDELDLEKAIANRKKGKEFLEQLIQYYLNEDIEGIEMLMSLMPDEQEEKKFNKRNEVMTASMDSLMKTGSYVAAVGCAHLPGKEGLVSMLRKKGYTVEPVITTTRTHANNYAVKPQTLTWIEVNEPEYGYSVRMPGKPGPVERENSAMKMNMYVDLTSMKLYCAAYTVPGVMVTAKNADSLLQAMTGNFIRGANGDEISRRRFSKNKFEGIEFVYSERSDKMYVRMQVFANGKRVYLVGYGSKQEKDINDAEAESYFNSFVIHETSAQAWTLQTFNDHYFRVSFPTKAFVNILPTADTTIRAAQIYSVANDNFFGVGVATANAGFNFDHDTAYFALLINQFTEKRKVDDLQQKDTLFEGFAAKRFTAMAEGFAVNCLIINRGNRNYMLTAVTSPDEAGSPEIAAFFRSFSFVEYPKLTWQLKKLDGYALSVPMPGNFTHLSFDDDDSTNAPQAREYRWRTYDSATATTFYLSRRHLSQYTWVKHDSVLLKKLMNDLVHEGEQLLNYKFVTNGTSNGIEFNVGSSVSSIVQRIRILLNGEAVYYLQADVPAQYWKQNEYARFLEDVRFDKEAKPQFLYTNSLQKFITALNATDSTTYTKAYLAIDQLIFDSTEYADVLRAATTNYPLDTLYGTGAGTKLLNVLGSTDAVVTAIAKHYSNAEERFKYDLLTRLAQQHTLYSYNTIEKLLQQKLPAEGNASTFVWTLGDSLELTKTLYPSLITLSGDSILGCALFHIHELMLDSNLITIDAFKPYHDLIMKTAKRELVKVSADKDLGYTLGFYGLMSTLKRLNTDSAKLMLRKFANVPHTRVKYLAVTHLLEVKQPVNASILEAIAADNLYRIDIYDKLKEMGQEKLFPAKYLNQKSFAESYAYNASEDTDMESAKFSLAGERMVTFKGRKQKFYLFKVTFNDNGVRSSYLAIAGPFKNAQQLLLDPETHISGFYWDEEFSQSRIDKLFKSYLKMVEENDAD